MNFDTTTPCNNCPFRRQTVCKLRPERIDEITDTMLASNGSTFQCHKTLKAAKPQHCAGALIFAMKHETLPQLARICHRMGMIDETALMANKDAIYDSVDEMQEDHAEPLRAKS